MTSLLSAGRPVRVPTHLILRWIRHRRSYSSGPLALSTAMRFTRKGYRTRILLDDLLLALLFVGGRLVSLS
jgi:hypothetical protein